MGDSNQEDGPMSLEVDLAELRRISRLRRLLDLPSNIHQEQTPQCRGECESPTALGVLGLTCCHLYLARASRADLAKLEKQLRQRVKRGRNELRDLDVSRLRREQVRGTGLAQTYPREHTGTYALRVLKLDDDVHGKETPNVPVPPKEHLRKPRKH